MPNWAQPPLPARLDRSGTAPFVGRRHELERLEKIWGQVEEGHRQAVFIGGEPGSGKSRLAAETGRALHRNGVAVLLGTTSDELSYPYQPLVEALDHLLNSTEAGNLGDVLPDSAAELLRITPNVRRHRRDLPEPLPGKPEYRHELFDAYTELMRSLVCHRSTALILEDLHWSSAPTKLLLSHLVQSIEDAPLLIIGTMRNTAPDRSDDLGLMIANLHRLPGVARIDLTGLEADDIEAFLANKGSSSRAQLAQAAALLRDQTGGNPLFLQELWEEIAKSGGIKSLSIGQISPTRTVTDTLERRIRKLRDDTRDVLEMAAILGDRFNSADLASARGAPREAILEALDQAIDFGLITPEPTGAALGFHHTLVRNTVLARLPLSRSASLHARLAEIVEGRYESNPNLAPTLARLYAGAGALGYEAKISHYHAEAARQAERGLAHEEAASLWERAAESTSERETREEMLLCAGQNHKLAGEFSEARRIFTRVHGGTPDARLSLRAAIGYEDSSWRPGLNGETALEMLSTSLQRVEDRDDDRLYIEALAALGRAHAFAGDLEGAEPITMRALELARRASSDRLISLALHASIHRFWSKPGPDEFAMRAAAEMREIAMRTRQYEVLAPAGIYHSFASYMSGDIEGWLEGWADLQLAVAKTAQPFWGWVEGCFEQCQHFMNGEFELAVTTVERIRELGYSFGTDDTEGPYGIQMFMIRRETGMLDSVRPMISGDPSTDGTWTPGLLALYTELDMGNSARQLLEQLTGTMNDLYKKTSAWPAILVFMTEAALYLNDRRALKLIWPLLSEYEGLNLQLGQAVAIFGSADRYLAQAAAALGRFEEAEKHFESALEMDERSRSLVHQAETLARFGGFLRTRRSNGDMERVIEYESRARELAESSGHERVLRILERQSPQDLPDGLTPREIDVVRLLARGASNREIGEALHISQNTAANHVRSILIKTGTPNRTAAAIYATESDLLD